MRRTSSFAEGVLAADADRESWLRDDGYAIEKAALRGGLFLALEAPEEGLEPPTR